MCRFVHCTRDEEEYYRATGELPRHVLETTIRKGKYKVKAYTYD